MADDTLRPGEVRLDRDPALSAGDAQVVFIGHVQSNWNEPAAMPKNPAAARQSGAPATLAIEPRFRAGLRGLENASHIIVLAWLHRARRDVVVVHPKHVDAPRGVFALRSPVRPNPIGVSVARILAIDEAKGLIQIDAIDFLDGTPLIDIKPYRPGIDSVPDAVVS